MNSRNGHKRPSATVGGVALIMTRQKGKFKMKHYIFNTTATMKEYNSKKWWIDSEIVREIQVEAENVKQALKKYREIVMDRNYIEISENALRCKNPMYIDTPTGEVKQVGYVITGKTEFEDRENYKRSAQYIDLWVTIITVIDTEFEEVKI